MTSGQFVDGGTFTFALKDSNVRKVHSAHAQGELGFRGLFHMQGPQPVDNKNGAPEWVADYFDKNPEIDQIALSGKKHSVIYSRIVE